MMYPTTSLDGFRFRSEMFKSENFPQHFNITVYLEVILIKN